MTSGSHGNLPSKEGFIQDCQGIRDEFINTWEDYCLQASDVDMPKKGWQDTAKNGLIKVTKLSGNQQELLLMFLNLERLMLLRALIKKPNYISDLARGFRCERGTVAFHLAALLNVGLVSSEYRILEGPTKSKKGKAARYYSVNMEKLGEVVTLFTKIFPYPK